MIKTIASVILVTSLTGCSTVDLNSLVDSAYIIKANEGVTETALKAELTLEERQTILDAETAMKSLLDFAESIKSDPTNILFADQYIENASNAYKKAKLVVEANRLDYDQFDWEGLLAADAQFTAMYERYQDFKAQQKYQEAASQLGEYAKLGIKLAFILGG